MKEIKTTRRLKKNDLNTCVPDRTFYRAYAIGHALQNYQSLVKLDKLIDKLSNALLNVTQSDSL